MSVAGKFASNTSGNVAIIFALAATAIFSVVGLGVDFQRAVSAETDIQNALDATTLAAAKALHDPKNSNADIQKEAKAVFRANIGMANVNLVCPDPTLSVDRQSGRIAANITCALPTTIAGLFSLEKMDVSRSSTSAIRISNLDLAMMLDVSGSMSGSKIRDLKTASKDAIDILITPYSGDRVRIGFNTYSTAVNIGDYAKEVKGSAYDKKSPLRHCVTERDGIAKFDDDAPGTGKYLQETMISTDGKVMSCPKSSIEPLTSNATKLKNEISKLNANGWTAGHLGVAWAWYLISPDWEKIWPAASKPLGYDEVDTIKAVILMTDGEFNTYYESGQGDSDRQAEKLCDNMKREGVIVYSVAFQAPKAGKKILQTCATDKDHFYEARNGQQLRDAYAEIASQLTNLRIAS